jgi:hypothetical protein
LKNVELLSNSFLCNFLPSGCANLPDNGLEYRPYPGSRTIIVSYSDEDKSNATLVYRVQNCLGEYNVANDQKSQKKRQGGRPSIADSGKRVKI